MAEVESVMLSGDEIGNHTLSHVGLAHLSPVEVSHETDKVDQQIEGITGSRPVWVRAATGAVDRSAVQQVAKGGQLYANWSIHAEDTDWSYGPERIRSNVTRNVRPGDIILIHQTRPATVEILPAILADLNGMGYRVVTLSELAKSAAGEGRSPLADTREGASR